MIFRPAGQLRRISSRSAAICCSSLTASLSELLITRLDAAIAPAATATPTFTCRSPRSPPPPRRTGGREDEVSWLIAAGVCAVGWFALIKLSERIWAEMPENAPPPPKRLATWRGCHRIALAVASVGVLVAASTFDAI